MPLLKSIYNISFQLIIADRTDDKWCPFSHLFEWTLFLLDANRKTEHMDYSIQSKMFTFVFACK